MRFCGYRAGTLRDEGVWGIGSWRDLTSRGLQRLASFCGFPGTTSAETDAGTSRFNAALLTRSSGPDAGEERVEFDWDVEIVEEELTPRVLPS